VLFVDSDRGFAEQSPGGVPGGEWFYEHVHLTFEGNYLLARLLAPQIEKLLAARLPAAGSNEWPSIAACARRLGWTDWNRGMASSEILTRISDAPFTHQLDHDQSVKR